MFTHLSPFFFDWLSEQRILLCDTNTLCSMKQRKTDESCENSCFCCYPRFKEEKAWYYAYFSYEIKPRNKTINCMLSKSSPFIILMPLWCNFLSRIIPILNLTSKTINLNCGSYLNHCVYNIICCFFKLKSVHKLKENILLQSLTSEQTLLLDFRKVLKMTTSQVDSNLDTFSLSLTEMLSHCLESNYIKM